MKLKYDRELVADTRERGWKANTLKTCGDLEKVSGALLLRQPNSFLILFLENELLLLLRNVSQDVLKVACWCACN